MQTFKTILLLVATGYAAWFVGYYMGERDTNEKLVTLESVGLIEPLYVDSAAPALWVVVK